MRNIRYTPRSRRRRKSNTTRFITTIIIIAAAYFAVRWIWKEEEPKQDSKPQSIEASSTTQEKPETRELESKPQEPRSVTVIKTVSTEVVKEPLKQPTDISVTTEAIAKADSNQSTNLAPQPEATVLDTQEKLEKNEAAKKLVVAATRDIQDGKIIAARTKLNEALRMPLTNTQRDAIKEKLSDLSEIWLFSDKVLPGDNLCSYYKVKPGDLMSTIGKEYNVPWELLLKLNDILRPENLRAGERIKVVKGPFNAIIYKDTFTMDLYLQQTYVKSYKVGIGMVGKETPTGTWVVKNDKLISPNWTDQETGKVFDATDPDYPLGKRWIGIKGISGDAVGKRGFALHGTKDPESIGTRCSRGCVRLLNKDILEVYDLMVPFKSRIQIKDSSVE